MVLTPELAACIELEAHVESDRSIDPARFQAHRHGQYTFAVERMRDIMAEIEPQHRAHWGETEKYRHGLPFAPLYDDVLADERRGTRVQFTVRDADGALAGNLAMYLGVSRHSGTVFAREDTLYFAPAHRGGMTVVAFLRYAEPVLRELGAREIRVDSKLVNRADVLMRRLGYAAVSMQFVKMFER